MCRKSGMALIVLGAILILAPIALHGVAAAHDKERIASFYERYPDGAVLPPELRPSEYTGYDWACFGIGVAMAFVGVARTGNEFSARPKQWATSEV